MTSVRPCPLVTPSELPLVMLFSWNDGKHSIMCRATSSLGGTVMMQNVLLSPRVSKSTLHYRAAQRLHLCDESSKLRTDAVLSFRCLCPIDVS
jgi:hypothetical protein